MDSTINSIAYSVNELAIWEKLVSWNIVLENKSQQWYEMYKLFAIKIYQKNLIFLTNHLPQYIQKLMLSGKKINNTDFYVLIHNFLFLICIFSEDDKMLDFYFNSFNELIDINHIETITVRYFGNMEQKLSLNYLMHVIIKNSKSLSIVKYLVEKCGIDLEHIDNEDFDCLHYAIIHYEFKSKASLEIVKYLIDECKMDIFNLDWLNRTYLTHACCSGKADVKLIKYLIEEKNMNVSIHLSVEYFFDIIFANYQYAVPNTKENNNNKFEIFAYIVDLMDISKSNQIKSSFNYVSIDVFGKFINCIKDREKFNIICKSYFIDYINSDVYKTVTKRRHDINKFLCLIDPSLLNEANSRLIGIEQLKLNYDEFVRCVDEFKFKNDNYLYLKTNLKSIREKNIQTNDDILKQYIDYDFSQKYQEQQTLVSCCSEVLFIHNNIPYYGNRKTIYNSILLLKDIDLKNITDDIVLEGNLPKYLVNMYLNSIISKRYNLVTICPDDIFKFVKFIDQYPSDVLSIDKLELDLVEYFEENDIQLNEMIKSLCFRYKFKYTYVYFHNKNKYLICGDEGYDENNNAVFPIV
jgi:hypothetical protein